MRKLIATALLAFLALFAGAAAQPPVTADIDESTDDPPLPEHEFITGSAVEPAPGSETPQKDPFKPYDIGDPASAIPYEALSPAEKVVVDRGRNVDGWRQVHDAYATAIAERAKHARARAAAQQLGVDELETQGVVP